MTDMIIEAVIMAFVVGGIVGAAAALCLRSSRFWGPESTAQITEKPVPVNSNNRPTIRRNR